MPLLSGTQPALVATPLPACLKSGDLPTNWRTDSYSQPGIPVARLLTEGIADLGFQQRSELSGVPGVRILGPMPAGAGIRTVFTVGVLTRSTQREPAGRILNALASDKAIPALERHWFRQAC
jgi:ABC-type molybdate transport system substrate-binding protein